MCGIVGAVAQRNVAPILLEGLKRLEYRGYDSAGVAILNDVLQRKRIKGKVQGLYDALMAEPIKGNTGIAHTRWATHGVPSEENAHPHMSGDDIAVVHNGIIENHNQLRDQLLKEGYSFTSQTDTEIIAHLLHKYIAEGKDLRAAARLMMNELEGAFALGIVYRLQPQSIIAIRRGSPLVIGIGLGEHFIASDHLALLPVAQRFVYLEEGDIAEINLETYKIFDAEGKPAERKIKTIELQHDVADRGQYRHFMLKEIVEQPEVIAETLQGRLSKNSVFEQAFGEKAATLFDKTKRIQIVACGTSYHAGMVARYWLEALAGIPCQVEIASEQRYRDSVVEEGTLFVTISQSGETADTLAALRSAKEKDYLGSLAICNVPESSLVRESDLVFMTRAGAEIGVASTKAFTTQLVSLLMLTVVLGKRHAMDEALEARIVTQLNLLPKLIKDTLAVDNEIKRLSEKFVEKDHALFLGRGIQYPIAREGALKLKEISYIHAEAYPAGELKHGPLALVDKEMPVITVAPNDELLEKLKSNLQEVRARGGELYVFADQKVEFTSEPGVEIISIPSVDKIIAPIVYTIPLQLLSYHVAVLRGTDVDQPRNLAKSVTVE